MTESATLVTAAEIGRIAGVTRATVSNWRRRHGDFPAPIAGTDSSPLYDLTAVRAWLDARGQVSAASPTTELRTTLRLHPDASNVVGRLLPLIPVAARLSPGALTDWAALPDKQLTARAQTEAKAAATDIIGAAGDRLRGEDVAAIRALLSCVRAEGGRAALDVLAERELEGSAAAGVYQTPAGLAELMAALLPSDCTSVLDPACGSGTLLAAAARRGASTLYGQDALPVQAQRAAVGLLLSSPTVKPTVWAGDSLRGDRFPDVTVDGVLCNPPYGDRAWGQEELAYDPRWAYGLPPRSEPELAWIQHALAHLKPGGYAVFVLPPAVASRPSGRRVRAELVRAGAVRAVMALPVGAAVPLHIGLHLWVLQRPEAGGPVPPSVLFVDLSGGRRAEGRATSGSTLSASRLRHRRENLDWAGLSRTALGHWEHFRDDAASYKGAAGEAHAVSVLDLLDEVVDLTPSRHVRNAPAALDPGETARQVREGRKQLTALLESLTLSASRGTWEPAGASARTWRTATLSDLARGGTVEMLRASPATDPTALEAWFSENAGRLVLTATDIARDDEASGSLDELSSETAPDVKEGDVLLRTVAGGGGPMARVADQRDAGTVLGRTLLLLRPDPSRLDAWFLAGFLDEADNIAGASTGSTTIQVQPGRLRVPLLPLDDQRRYGNAFRLIRELRLRARRAAEGARATADLLTTGLTTGALVPPDDSS